MSVIELQAKQAVLIWCRRAGAAMVMQVSAASKTLPAEPKHEDDAQIYIFFLFSQVSTSQQHLSASQSLRICKRSCFACLFVFLYF